jgi:hypothetical protein
MLKGDMSDAWLPYHSNCNKKKHISLNKNKDMAMFYLVFSKLYVVDPTSMKRFIYYTYK